MLVFWQCPLLDAPQSGAVPAMPPQKKSAQIGRLATDNRKQFRIRAALPDKALPGTVNAGIRSGHGYPPRVGTAHNSRKGKGGYQPMVRLFLTALVALILVLLLASPAR